MSIHDFATIKARRMVRNTPDIVDVEKAMRQTYLVAWFMARDAVAWCRENDINVDCAFDAVVAYRSR